MLRFFARSINSIALIIAVFVAAGFFVFLYFGELWEPHWVALAVVIMVLVYYFSAYAIAVLIDSRIKPLYQFIGARSPRKIYKSSNKSISMLEGEMRVWVERSVKEMDTLRMMENYRKEFLGNVSHELKTPLFSLQGYIDTLLSGASDNPTVCRKYLERSDKNIERLINIVHDLEDISRLESNQLVLFKTNFDISSLIADVYLSMETLYKEAGVEMRALPKVAMFVNADRVRIEQVLTNLLSNAMKYNTSGGWVKVEIVDMFDSVMISVIDNGFGIENEHQPRLFERFYRVDKARSRNIGGTGLGLAIVKHIVEAHGQTINVQSQIGMGSTFYFTLPKASL